MPALTSLSALAPDATALVDDAGALSAAALHALVRDERAWLGTSGGRRFALLADNGRSWAITDLALLAARLVNVPLPQHFSSGQLAHALATAGVDAVASDQPRRLLELGLGFVPIGRSPQTGLTLLRRRGLDHHAFPLPPGTVKVTYTSGSTAEPKGVCLTRPVLETVAASVAMLAAKLGIRRHLCVLPLATLLENVAGLYAAWLAGATCHLPSSAPAAIASGSLTPAQFLGDIRANQPESMILVPELLRLLMGGAAAGWHSPGMRFVAVGGARVSPDLLKQAAALGLPVFEGYGLSECGSVTCLNTPGVNRTGSAGRPLPHARVRIDAGGEILVSGTVMAGYVGAAAPAGGEIATGDLGEIDEQGFVHVRGRLKNVFINSFGRNISPEWIESELTREPDIGQAIACGEGQTQVVALVTPAHAQVDEAAVGAAIARANIRLPPYARVLRHFVIPAPERFSIGNGLLTGNGRPRRERILERYADTIARLHAGAATCPSMTA
ncbi:MAG: AMP-binding protein [Gammaproteobacteria bacterium]|nr:AMP-binding protein [Gammaproteobacteria bacterium]